MTGPTMRARIAEQFDGLRSDFVIKDATKPMTVTPTDVDARNAKKLDPAHCVLAEAIQRTKGEQVLVFRRVAYVKHSSRTVLKYTLGSQTGNVTEAFDQSGSFPVGVSFVFKVPDEGHSTAVHSVTGPAKKRPDSSVSLSLALTPPTGRDKVGGTAGKGGHGKRGERRSIEVKVRTAEAKAKTAAFKRPLGPELP